MIASPHRARGLTILESVLATVLLGVVASVLLAALNTMWRSQVRLAQTLGAAETANRVVLQYLDDRSALESQAGRPLNYGAWSFRWQLEETSVRYTPPAGVAGAAAENRLERGMAANFNRLKMVRVRVWLDERNEGGSFLASAAVPHFEMTRLVDPLNIGRNPDSLKKVFANPDLIMRALGQGGNLSIGSEEGPP